MKLNHRGVFLAIMSSAACSAPAESRDTDVGVDVKAADDSAVEHDSSAFDWSSDPDRRISSLIPAEIAAICANVERRVDVECTPEGGESYTILETPGARDCIAALESLADSEDEACILVVDVVECWNAEPCERLDTGVCRLECPERKACWGYSVEECRAAEQWCWLRSGTRFDSENDCFVETDAYCMPNNYGCTQSPTTAQDPDGACWGFSSGCELPEGWSGGDYEGESCSFEGASPCP